MRNLVHVAMLASVAACSGVSETDDPSTSLDALSSEGTPDTTLTRMFLKPAPTSFERGRPGAIRFIVIHDIEGPASSAVSTFREHGAQTSAHYIVDSNGAIVQMVHESDVANHAGHALYNGYGVGIEHSGHAKHDEYTDAEYRGSAKLAADVAKRHGIPLDAQHIVGHSQVPRVDEVLSPCGRTSTICGGHNQHDDPGPFWNWAKYMDLVKAAAQAIGYAGVGVADPQLAPAPVASIALERTLPGAYWITQCAAAGGMQTAFRTVDNESRAESRYVQRATGPCGDATEGAFPYVFHGLARSDVLGVTVHACEQGSKHTYEIVGDVPCGADNSTCAIASLVETSASSCP